MMPLFALTQMFGSHKIVSSPIRANKDVLAHRDCDATGDGDMAKLSVAKHVFLTVPAVRALCEPQHEGSFARARACSLALDMFPHAHQQGDGDR